MILIPPPLTEAEARQVNNPALANPILQFSTSLNIMANVTIQSLTDKALSLRLQQQGATASFSLGTGTDGITPLITVSAKGADPANVLRTAEIMMEAAKTEVTHQQALLGIPPSTYIRAIVLVHPDTPQSTWGGRLKDLAAAVGLTFLLTLLVANGVDRRAQRQVRPLTGLTPLVNEPQVRPLRTTFAGRSLAPPAAEDGRSIGS